MKRPPVPVIVACWLALLGLMVPILQEPRLDTIFVASSAISGGAIILHGYGSIANHGWSARWGLRLGSFGWFVAVMGILTDYPLGESPFGWFEVARVLTGLALGTFLAAEAPAWRD